MRNAQREDRIRLCNYVLGRGLGTGSFGKVKLAEHLLTNQLVAVKILNRKHMREHNVTKKVSREVRILQKFSHPHIIRLFDVIETPSDIFLILEYGSNGELFDYIVAKRALPEDEARKYFQQLISGLAYCHAHKITHRDLKPENLLLTADNDIKLADFGLSNVIENGQFLRTSCGSPNYAAPEVIAGHVYFGPEVDLWSCGVILFALLTGTLPFDDDNLGGLFKRIKSGYYNMPAYLKPEARDLISKLLLVEPLKRATIEKVVASKWYKKNLPKYLNCPILEQGTSVKALDEEIIQQVCTKLSNSNYVATTGRKGVIKAVQAMRTSEVKVVYDLLLFEKHGRERTNPETVCDDRGLPNRNFSDDSVLNVLNQSDDLGTSTSDNRMQVEFNPDSARRCSSVLQNNIKTENILSSSPFARSCASKGSEFNYNQMLNKQPPKETRKRRWFLGIQSKKEPDIVINEVFRVLRSLGGEWTTNPKVPYRVTCRWKFNQDKYTYFQFQLYKVQDNICLLDFLRLSKSFPTHMFVEISARIINSLKPPSPKRR